MSKSIPSTAPQGTSKFQQVVDAFLSAPGLPFANILSAERIERIFAKHGCLFGLHGIYSTATMVWPFLSQVLRDGKLEQGAEEGWLRKGRHADLLDGFTFTMPDTAENQAVYPRPEWMDEATQAQIPETLQLREIRHNIVEPGRRTRTMDVITTLVDAEAYPKEAIAELFGFRWSAELDIRSIKSLLNLGHVRCKSPEMVGREVWTTILGYHLIRTTAAGAALLHGKQPRQISFTGTCQYVLASWMRLSSGLIEGPVLGEYLQTMLRQIACCEVADRPGRLEPRVLKRRRHGYKLMRKPRHELRRELRKHCT